MNTSLLDRQMEQVYRYVPMLGHTRAIEEVAGQTFDASTDTFRPNYELQKTLRARYDAEMRKFQAAGGY